MRAPPFTAINSGSGIGALQAVVVTPGVAVQLADTMPTLGVTVRALAGNTGLVYVGDSTVSASTGFELLPGEALSLDVGTAAFVYIDAEQSGDGVCVVWVKA